MTRKSTLFTLVFALFAFVQGQESQYVSPSELKGQGTQEDPYRIENLEDWNNFAACVNGGFNSENNNVPPWHVKLTSQIENITTMVGNETYSFRGTFDGDGHALTFNIDSEKDFAAPFRFVKNAVIKNLSVASSRTGNSYNYFRVGKFGSALVGKVEGQTLIENVHVMDVAVITSSRADERYLGGLVGHGGTSTLTLKDIRFEGAFVPGEYDVAFDYVGGLVGWNDGMTLNLENCTFWGKFSGEGRFHPIALREKDVPMQGTVSTTYFHVNDPRSSFYVGPKNVDDSHIAVKAVRVQNSMPTDVAYGTVTDAFGNTSYYYNDAPQGFSIDYDKERGEPGYYYLNLEEQQFVFDNPDFVFKVYDDGGKIGNYTAGSGGSLKLQAPEGYVFEFTGKIVKCGDLDQLSVYDGWNDYLDPMYFYDSEEMSKTIDNIGTYETTDNKMLISFSSQSDLTYAGFELTVRMKPNAHIHNITFSPQEGGTWSVEDGGNTAIATHNVTIVFAPENNRILSSLKVVKTDDVNTEVEITKDDDTHYSFTMPDYDVTVVPSPYDWQWTSGHTICHLNSEGIFTVSAVPGTDGAMADYSELLDRPWAGVKDNITSVVVEEGVTVIGKNVFEAADNLNSVLLPEGLLEIHDQAFAFCSNLGSIQIPYTVVSVSAGAFSVCSSLEHVYLEARAEDISWGSYSRDFMQDAGAGNWPQITVMHVYPSQLAVYQNKFKGSAQLNVTFYGDLDASGNWTNDGNYAKSFSQQEGNTITITNEKELARLAYMVNNGHNYKGYTFKLARNMNMLNHAWTPIGDYNNHFMGTFDGQNHTINGIVVNRSGEMYNGLFGWVGDLSGSEAFGEVKNVRLMESSITGGNYTGGLVGRLHWGNLTNSYTDAAVNGGQYTGGLVGQVEGLSANRIYASVIGSLYLGSHVSGGSNTHLVVGSRDSYSIVKSYYTNKDLAATSPDVYAVQASVETPDGITVTFSNEGKVVYEGKTYYATDGSATFGVYATDRYYTIQSVTVNGSAIGDKAGTYTFESAKNAATCTIGATLGATLAGNGTEGDPYLISNIDDWNLFAELVAGGATFSGKFVRLNGYFTDVNPIPTMVGESEELSFQGTFDGKGSLYSIYGNIDSSVDNAALFRYVKNATIKNVRILGGSFSVGPHGSALVGRTYGTTRIENVYVSPDVTITSDNGNLGGLVGHGGNSTLTLEKIDFRAKLVNNGGYTGGLVGWSDDMTLNMNKCTFRGSFSGTGAFHPIAVRDSFKRMSGAITETYFYTGPNSSMDNAHIAVTAIRVQTTEPTDGSSEGTRVYDHTNISNVGYYYNDAPQGLSIDYDKERGTPGYYYANVGEGNQRLVVGEDATSFTIYDNEGKLGADCGTINLTLVAPEGKAFEVTGRVEDMDPYDDILSITDDLDSNLFFFGGKEEQEDPDAPYSAEIPTGTSSVNVLFVNTQIRHYHPHAGFELQLSLVEDGAIRSGAVTIRRGYTVAFIDGNYKGTDEVKLPQGGFFVNNVVLDRTFTAEKYATVVLPFGIDLDRVDGAKFYGLSQMEYDENTKKWTASATEVSGKLNANTPYLVYPEKASITFNPELGVTLQTDEEPVTTSGNWEFRGAYGRVNFGDESNASILGKAYGFVASDTTINGKKWSKGQFAKAGSGAYIPPMRAYLVYNEANGAAKDAVGLGFGGAAVLPDVIEVKIMDEQGQVTETVVLNPATGAISKDRWFDIQGRQLKAKPTIKGRYLHNGKIEVVK